MPRDRLFERIARMTRDVPLPPPPPSDPELWVRLERDHGIDRPLTAADHAPTVRPGWTLDADRMTRRQAAGYPLGKQADPLEAGGKRVPVPSLADHTATWAPPDPAGRRAKIRKPRRVKRPRWCRQCGRLELTCATIGKCP